jgi:hypothetical protein
VRSSSGHSLRGICEYRNQGSLVVSSAFHVKHPEIAYITHHYRQLVVSICCEMAFLLHRSVKRIVQFVVFAIATKCSTLATRLLVSTAENKDGLYRSTRNCVLPNALVSMRNSIINAGRTRQEFHPATPHSFMRRSAFS